MNEAVARRLHSIGFTAPIAIDALPGKWWTLNVDLAALDEAWETGCATQQVDATTEQIESHYVLYYCEVVAGPFNQPDAVEATYLASADCDREWLGNRASALTIPFLVARRLATQGLVEPVVLSALAGKYWVCGMSGGVCSTDELVARIGNYGHRITDGPFNLKEDADYAFDVLWESPE